VVRCVVDADRTLPTQSILRAPSSRGLLLFQAYQFPDDSGPLLPPDFIDGKDQSEQPASIRRITYNERIMNSPSASLLTLQAVCPCLFVPCDPSKRLDNQSKRVSPC
jgi:hypothetical protein